MILSERDRKRLSSKEWRLNHLYKIIDKNGDIITFKFNDEQRVLFNRYQEKRKTLGLREYILKDRQIGITTFHILYYLDEVMWSKGKTAAIIAHEREALEKIFRKAKLAWEMMPEPFRPVASMENKRELAFKDINSNMYIALKVRSGTVHHLHVSEIAYIREYDELKAGSFSTVPMKGNITCESTGNGMNKFYDDWVSGEVSKIWHNHFFSFVDHLAYVSDFDLDDGTYDDYLKDLSQDKKNWWYMKYEELGKDLDLMKQEYPLTEEDAFRKSGKGIFLPYLSGIETLEPIRVEDNVEIYKEVESRAQYCMGVDSSMGYVDGDAGCFFIIDNRTWEIVMRWHGRVPPDTLGDEIVKWATEYNNAFVGIEENNGGIAVINTVKDQYSNLYQRERRDRVSNELTKQLGWYTTEKSKGEIIAQLIKTLRDKDISTVPKTLYHELHTFVKKDSGKTEAEDGFHDDQVMAFGISILMILHNPYIVIKRRVGKYMGH